MKLSRIVALLLIPILAGCASNKTELELFVDEYYRAHPDGYSLSGWHSFESSCLIEDFIEKTKTIQEIQFVGDILLNKDSFDGQASCFEMSINSLTTSDSGEIFNKWSEYVAFKDHRLFDKITYFSSSDVVDKIAEYGATDIPNAYVEFRYFAYSFVFYPRLYDDYITGKCSYSWGGYTNASFKDNKLDALFQLHDDTAYLYRDVHNHNEFNGMFLALSKCNVVETVNKIGNVPERHGEYSASLSPTTFHDFVVRTDYTLPYPHSNVSLFF